jgi:general stress protein YciG
MRDSNPVVVAQPPSPSPIVEPEVTKKKRGFAAMNRDQVRELARRGGAAAHRAGTAHEFSSEEARAAGRKGGLAAHASGKPLPTDHSQDTN